MRINKSVLTIIAMITLFALLTTSNAFANKTEEELFAEWQQQVQDTANTAAWMKFNNEINNYAQNITNHINGVLSSFPISLLGLSVNVSYVQSLILDYTNFSFNVNQANNTGALALNFGVNLFGTVGIWYNFANFTLDMNNWTWNAGNNTNVADLIQTLPPSFDDYQDQYYAQNFPQPNPTPDIVMPIDDGDQSGGDPMPLPEDLGVAAGPSPHILPPVEIETTLTPEGLTVSNYMATFFSNPVSKDLKLYVPGYAYFQGIVYSKGSITALGPIRVIGGVINKTPDGSQERKGIAMKKGAMLTTDPEYLNRRTNPPQVRLRVTQWEEIPAALKGSN